MIQKRCTVEIKGGFGNQLFQYNFANYLRSQGLKVRVSNTFYKELEKNSSLTLREEILKSTIFGFKNISFIEKLFLKALKKINDSKKIQTIFPFFKDNFYKYYKDNDYTSSDPKQKISQFDGYWQDIKYLHPDVTYLKNCLKKIPEIKNAIDKKPIKESFMIIVRRGDYVEMGQELSLNFYRECFENIYKISQNPIINVFTDDVMWVNKQTLFEKVNKIYGPEKDPKKVLYLFSEMMNHENYFICNSTFSFFAALIGSTKNSKIFIADPWFRNRESKNLSFENWKKIQNS